MNVPLLKLVLHHHGGQTREGCREDQRPDPQVEHVLRCWAAAVNEPEVQNVILAHDLLEDCPSIDEEQIKEVISEAEFEAVKLLTHKKGIVPYPHYLMKLYDNHLARRAKWYDSDDNYHHAAKRWRRKYKLVREFIDTGNMELMDELVLIERNEKDSKKLKETSSETIECDLMWHCRICGAYRPDEKISVFTRDLSHIWNLPDGSVRHNVNYCNDSQDCYEGAKKYKHFNYDEIEPA